MKFAQVLAFLCLAISADISVSARNILIFHSISTASHRTSLWPLVEKLGDEGHNITYVFPVRKRPGSHPQVTELQPSKMLEAVEKFVGDFDINIRLNNKVDEWLQEAFLQGVTFCEAFYDSPETHQWLATPGLHYDLIIMDACLGQCAYGLVHKFKAKHILFTPVTLPFLWDSMGVVPESAHVPEFMFNQKPGDLQTSLVSRTITTLATGVWRHAFLGCLRSMETIARDRLNLTDMPDFETIEQDTSLVLRNADFVEEYPMSLPPMFVSYSGLLCREKDIKGVKPLPKELESFVGGKDSEGFVYISFGSAVMLSMMPEPLMGEFFGALAQFPNLRFLIRWKGDVPAIAPKNVLFQSWFPQKDVLAHPKIKGFVFQAGRPSTQEALCFGVPMISIPIFADQDFDAHRLEQIGASVLLDIGSLTSENFAAAIREVVETDKYKTRLVELSKMFKDRPLDPLQNAHYWVEYVMRHNTSLLKPLGRHQTWWQRRLLDVYALLTLIVLAVISVLILATIFAIKLLVRKITGTSKTDKKTD